MESKPDVQLGKLFIILWIGFMLLIIILILLVYFNANSETSYCTNEENTPTSSNNQSSSMSRSTILFISFIVITFVATSAMNLTYKINYFHKKPVEPVKIVKNIFSLQKNQMAELPMVPTAPPINNTQFGHIRQDPRIFQFNQINHNVKPSAPPLSNNNE